MGGYVQGVARCRGDHVQEPVAVSLSLSLSISIYLSLSLSLSLSLCQYVPRRPVHIDLVITRQGGLTPSVCDVRRAAAAARRPRREALRAAPPRRQGP
jgi:hypothetical protein